MGSQAEWLEAEAQLLCGDVRIGGRNGTTEQDT